MKAIRIIHSEPYLESLVTLAKLNGFSISNPDQKTGNYFDIVSKNGQLIAGFDLILKPNYSYHIFDANKNLKLILDWVRSYGRTSKED